MVFEKYVMWPNNHVLVVTTEEMDLMKFGGKNYLAFSIM